MKKKYDVFIAYHGSYENGGTRKVSEELAKFLIKKGLNVYFYPFSKKDAYKTTIFEVINSNTFLLVTNEKIHRNEQKRIDLKHHYELAVEVDAFYSSTFLDENANSPLDSKVFFCGDYNQEFIKGDESQLHDLFKNRVHLELDKEDNLRSFYEVYDWILSRKESVKQFSYSSNRTSQEIKKLYSRRTSLIGGENLNELISVSKKIVSVGISNSDLTTRIDPAAIEYALENGAEIEIYFLDPLGRFTIERELEENFDNHRIREATLNNIQAAQRFKKSLPNELRANFRLYMYDKSPRLNIIFIDEKFYVQFYGFISRGMDTPSFVLEKQEGKSPLYDYCQKSYVYIKNNSWEIK